jgi:ATP-binding protein involved in chromosome partitioning
MEKISGSDNIGKILEKFPEMENLLLELEINTGERKFGEKSIVQIALEHKIPLQVLLNNISKATGLDVQWPKVSGMKESDFSASTGLRQGRPKGIKKIVAVHSGKGGVGKTFVAVTLANFLMEEGLRVGLLDLDIDCPNIMKTLGLSGKLVANDQKRIVPLDYRGIKVVSMGGIQEREDLAILWRGPVIAKAIEQLLHDTDWGDLDVLIVDFPPGTGDVPLTFFNLLKPDGVIVVTTPQKTSMTDAAKSIDMCRSLKVPVLGIIENMCGEIFGEADEKKWMVKYLGKIDLKKEYVVERFWENGLGQQLSKLFGGIRKLLFS